MRASAGVADAATEDIWNNIKTDLLKTTEEVSGITRPHRWHRDTGGGVSSGKGHCCQGDNFQGLEDW